MCMSFNQYDPSPTISRTTAITVIAHPGLKLPSYASCQNQRRGARIACLAPGLLGPRRRRLSQRPPSRCIVVDRLARNGRSELRARTRDLRVETRLLTLESGEALDRRDQ